MLLVEDDPALRLGVARALQSEGWQVDAVANGDFAITATETERYDAAVLDLGLPRRSGFDVLAHWRSNGHDLAVLILTATDNLSNRLRGLNGGADDYLPKPFEPEELIARLRAITRRRRGSGSNSLSIGDLVFDTDSRELRHRGERLPLSPREAALVELLMASPGHAVPKSRTPKPAPGSAFPPAVVVGDGSFGRDPGRVLVCRPGHRTIVRPIPAG